MAECFCGCGRNIGFGRRLFSNKAARTIFRDVEVLRGAAEREPQPDGVEEMRAVVDRGARLREHMREYVHGTRARRDLDRDALRKLINDVYEHRKRLSLDEDYVGWDMREASRLFAVGTRAPARIVGIEDTGVTVNRQPRAEIVLRVEPDGEEPFEARRKLIVSRVNLPKVGERVEVAYDPADREKVVFRIADLTDDAAQPGGAAQAADDPLERVKKLHELHQAGALTAEEFEREKARILGG